MGKLEHAVLLVLFLIVIRNNVNADSSQENPSGLLYKLFNKLNPMIVVVIDNKYSTSKNLRSSDGSGDAESLNDVVNSKNALRYINDILRSTGDDNDSDVNNANEKFARALRSRCDKFLECQVKCKKPKKKDCKKSCQQVFDHLMMCNPPPKWPRKTNKEVYEYHRNKMRNECDSGSDECKSESNECAVSDECNAKPKDSCESDGCN